MFEGASVKMKMPGNFEMKSMDVKEPNAVSLNLKDEKQGERKWNFTKEQIMNKLKDLYERLKGRVARRENDGRDDR